MKKNLRDIPKGSKVFVDANILIARFTHTNLLGQACTAFLERAKSGDIIALTSVHVTLEVIHRAMVTEAIKKFRKDPREVVPFLKKHPQAIQELREHLRVPSLIHDTGVSIEPATRTELYYSRLIRAEYALMANDSLVVAMMKKRKIAHLATNDDDFKRAAGIKVWQPR